MPKYRVSHFARRIRMFPNKFCKIPKIAERSGRRAGLTGWFGLNTE